MSVLNVIAPMVEAGLTGMFARFKGSDASAQILDFQILTGFRAYPTKNLFVFASTPLFEFVSFEADFGEQGKFSSEAKEPFSTVVAGIGLRF